MTDDPATILLELFEADSQKYFDEPAATPLFDRPEVAVADADDPWFERFKDLIGEFYWTPNEALALADAGTRAQSVICWSMPVAQIAREANRRQTETPARQWAYVRTFGEKFLTRLRHGLEQRLRDMGFAAIAPGVAPENDVRRRPGIGFSACWSERHTAFVAGLGTFGISGGLITRRGVAHRLGSVVTDMEIAPTPRPYGDDPFAWCLRSARGTCGACADRCPTTSIGETVHDRNKDACSHWAYGRFRHGRGLELFGWEGVYGCGLCQTAVPCEGRNPTEND